MELKQFMKTHRWKCIDITEAVNVSPATISQIANKRKREPSLGLARKLVEFSKEGEGMSCFLATGREIDRQKSVID